MSVETLRAEEKRLRDIAAKAKEAGTVEGFAIAASLLLHAALEHAQKEEAYWEALRMELERDDQLKPLPKLALVPFTEDADF